MMIAAPDPGFALFVALPSFLSDFLAAHVPLVLGCVCCAVLWRLQGKSPCRRVGAWRLMRTAMSSTLSEPESYLTSCTVLFMLLFSLTHLKQQSMQRGFCPCCLHGKR